MTGLATLVAHAAASRPLQWANLLREGRTLVMGVLNVTPDSFSDGGLFHDPAAAIAQAERMVAAGADIIDVGAESTRPYGGAMPVSAEQEIARLTPVLPVVCSLGRPVSIDTMKAQVARWALDQGAVILNDVWAFQQDSEMARLAAESGAPVVLMHNRDHADPAIDIMADIDAFFERSLAIADAAGVARSQIMLDPGIGFGKTPDQSLIVLAQIDRLTAFGLPLLVGASRKRFIDFVSPAPPVGRLAGSLAAHLYCVEHGTAVVRAHDVAETLQALRVAEAIRTRRSR
jgi:dihydropteroate synthase